MLTTTVCDDIITPTYPCGIEDTPQTLFHGARFAEYELVKNHDKHLRHCKVCRPNNNTAETDKAVIDLLEAVIADLSRIRSGRPGLVHALTGKES